MEGKPGVDWGAVANRCRAKARGSNPLSSAVRECQGDENLVDIK